MTTIIKKLLLISITLLLGVMVSKVMAQTTYNFTFSGTADLGDPQSASAVMSGTITVGTPLNELAPGGPKYYSVTGMTGQINWANGGYQQIIPSASGWFSPMSPYSPIDNALNSTYIIPDEGQVAVGWTTYGTGVTFSAGGVTYNLYNDSGRTGGEFSSYGIANFGTSTFSYGSFIVSGSA